MLAQYLRRRNDDEHDTEVNRSAGAPVSIVVVTAAGRTNLPYPCTGIRQRVVNKDERQSLHNEKVCERAHTCEVEAIDAMFCGFNDSQHLVLSIHNMIPCHGNGSASSFIHSGIYYKPGSLKAKNCIDGYKMLLKFAKENGIAMDLCGKLIVASNEKEKEQIQMLFNRGQENGLEGLKILNSSEIKGVEPFVEGTQAIYVPQTGIIDYRIVCQKLKEKIEKLGGKVITNFEVQNLFEDKNNVVIQSRKRKEIQVKIAVFVVIICQID